MLLPSASRLILGVIAVLALLPLPAAFAAPQAVAPVTFRVTAPATTPALDPVHITGDFQGWNPGSVAHRLTSLGGRLYEITLDLTVGATVQYKFTRGDWGKVEKGPSGEELPNRSHAVTGPATLNLTVANWADLPAGSTITGDVTTHTVPGFLSGRRVWVYLPPGYHVETSRRYPVLYMFDGQNVFDAATSFAGEWQVDESCETLIATGQMAPVIVVAVDNGGGARLNEYTPWYDPNYGAGGGADAHLQALADVLKPWVDATYRTQHGPAQTGLAGSSLGGLMSLYAAYARPDVFGRIAGLSPSIWWSGNELLDYVAPRPKPAAAMIYTDMGTLESGSMQDGDGNGIDDSIDDLRALRDLLIGQGFVPNDDLLVVEQAGGRHNESYWASRFPGALRFLFPPVVSGVPAVRAADAARLLPNVPNPFNPRTTIFFELPEAGDAEVRIYSLRGELVTTVGAGHHAAGRHEAVWEGGDRQGRQVPSGTYLARLWVGGRERGGAVSLSLVR